MIELKITDQNDNIIFRRMDRYSDTAEQIDNDDMIVIEQYLNDSSSDMFNLHYTCDDEDFHYNYSVLKHTDKESILKELPALIKDYNSHVAALPECHPAEHVASGEREGVSDEDMLVCGPSELSAESLERIMSRYFKKPNVNRFWWRRGGCRDWCSIVSPERNVDSLFGHFECRGGRDGCGGRGGRGGCDDVLGVIPGSFSGLGDSSSNICDDSCERVGCAGTSDNVEPVQEWTLTETQTRAIKDFIGFLRTQESWATLIDELKFYHNPDDPIGKTELIQKFCEHMHNKKKQTHKDKREKKR